jgi:hypothetical protein
MLQANLSFQPNANFKSSSIVDLKGSVDDSSSEITDVELFDNGMVLGDATLSNGSWTLAGVTLDPGVNEISGVATDAAGASTGSIPAPFSITTAINDEPWKSYEAIYNSVGDLKQEYYIKGDGSVYSYDEIKTLKNGNKELLFPISYIHSLHTHFFDNDETDIYSSDFSVHKEQTFYASDETSMNGFKNNLTFTSILNDDITANGDKDTFVFKKSFGADIIEDFVAAGNKHDILDLPSSEFSSIADVLSSITMKAGSAVLNFPGNGVDRASNITLVGVTKAELQAHPQDFKFHA